MNKIGSFKPHPSKDIERSRVSIGFECLDRELFKPEYCYEPLGLTGVKYARVQTGWAICEREKGVIDFTWLDEIVDSLLAQGVKPWFSVSFGNSLYMPDLPNPTGVGCVPLYYGEECLNAWRRYARALGEHYKGRVEEYEIWNESDIAHFWYPEKPSGRDYAKLISLTGAELRSADPEARIGSCMSGYSYDYVRVLCETLRPGEIDFHDFHCYDKVPELNRRESYARVMEQFRRAGHDVSFRMGEGGYPSWAYDGHWMRFKPGNNSSERQQAVAQLRMYFAFIAYGLDGVSFFQMADIWEKPYAKATEVIDKPAAHGILNGLTYTPKKSYYTISRIANLFRDDVHPVNAYIRCGFGGTTVENMSIQRFAYRRGGSVFYAYWLPDRIEDEKENRSGMYLETYCFEDCPPMTCPVLLDMFTGEVFKLDEVQFGENMMKVTGLPIGDYPMVICDLALIEDNLSE